MSRIIAGRARGRRLTMPAHQQTRPTTDRVREALFSALVAWADGPDRSPDLALESFSFLDLYAGSGAVGLEAASRGAGPVGLVEADRRTADLARANAQALGLDAAVHAAKVETFLATSPAGGFDIVWADPPYDVASEVVDDVVADLVGRGWLAEHGLVVVERSRRSASPRWPDVLGERWERRYGETTLHFAQPGEPDTPDDRTEGMTS
ncbi:16S rRNA (guanine(966)-N(2))-methyltransferase RsmD [Mariniluteicoccus flavus]